MSDSELRQRKLVEAEEPEEEVVAKSSATPPKEKKKSRRARPSDDEEDDYSPWVDVLRVLSFLFLASCGLSYVITGGESWWWGKKHMPEGLTYDYWKEMLKGPVRSVSDDARE